MTADFYNRDTIDSKLDAIHETLKSVDKRVETTNGRVTALERWMWIIVGGGAVLATMNIPNLSIIAKLIGG